MTHDASTARRARAVHPAGASARGGALGASAAPPSHGHGRGAGSRTPLGSAGAPHDTERGVQVGDVDHGPFAAAPAWFRHLALPDVPCRMGSSASRGSTSPNARGNALDILEHHLARLSVDGVEPAIERALVHLQRGGRVGDAPARRLHRRANDGRPSPGRETPQPAQQRGAFDARHL